MKIHSYSGKIEISHDDGVTWMQIEPVLEFDVVDFAKDWVERTVYTGHGYFLELKKALLERLVWGDRLN